MSLDVQRDGGFASKNRDLVSASRSQSASLLALHAVTALLANNTDLSTLLAYDLDPGNASALDTEQLSWLQSNSLAHGRRFDETSLPIPHIDGLLGAEASAEGNSPKSSHPSNEDVPSRTAPHGSSEASTVASAEPQVESDTRSTGDAVLSDVAPPEPEDQAQFDLDTSQLVDEETPKRPAKTVHLPPEKEQEERLQQHASDRRSQPSSEIDKHKHASQRARSDPASSPSSTLGAHSATTPMPADDSPNTSPDSETAVEVPLEFRPTPAEQRAKDEHDRQLSAQKAIARSAAMGDVTTADDQLMWEQREAAAREIEEMAATSERAGPEAGSLSDARKTDAEVFVEAKQAEMSATETSDARGTRIVSTSSASQDHIDPEASSPSERANPKTTLSQDRTVLPGGESPSVSPAIARTREGASLTSASGAYPSNSTPTRSAEALIAQLLQPQYLESLRGAASDPERDYLESLFRIQAHDSPHISTSALPDLVKSASKTISTDDHFASLHERMEYRILRRIYHLQNANKWSLRQMVKCREPEPPVTHQDHMMSEMKWMCKDFRAERRRRKDICAWLAQRCAEWVNSNNETRSRLQVQVTSGHIPARSYDEDVPDLDGSEGSPSQVELIPSTPKDDEQLVTMLNVEPELLGSVLTLQRSGMLSKALKQLPVWQPAADALVTTLSRPEVTEVSKFIGGKVVPKLTAPTKKRGRYDFEDEVESDDESHISKRARIETDLPPEDPNVAIFHADNKSIRDRLHAQNAFRPPSEFQMPSVSFYEFRYGSYWLAEDDHRLRRLAKEYAFNWSAISDQMMLPSRYKSGFDRRTPWECFERWVELEQLPAEMRKTVYFKTWYSRLEQSAQAVEKRYQAQLVHVQAQSNQTGIGPQQQPVRRRTLPMRVEKRKNQRYLWTVDAMRKNAKKRELAAYKQAEATRAAVQRKASQQAEPAQPRQQARLTPQQFSQKRYERDIAVAKMAQAQREKLFEQQRAAQAARAAAQHGLLNGTQAQQKLAAGQNAAVNGQVAAAQAQMQAASLTPQQRQQLQQQLAARNFTGAVNAQGVPQAMMQGGNTVQQQQNMQRMAAQMQRNGMPGQQQIAVMQGGNAASPGTNGLSNQQLYANNATMLAAYKAQQQAGLQNQMAAQGSPNQQQNMSASPSMGPPAMPANTPKQLSSGHIPTLIKIQNSLRAKYPQMPEEQLLQHATEFLKNSQRASAMQAAAGMNGQASSNNVRAYQHNQGAMQAGTASASGTNYSPQENSLAAGGNGGMAASSQHSYAQMMRQRQLQQMTHMQQTQSSSVTGSPAVTHSSPNLNPASPSMQFTNMAGQRPPSRSATTQMQRLGSSGGAVQSPGSLQASPRAVQANMAR